MIRAKARDRVGTGFSDSLPQSKAITPAPERVPPQGKL